MSNEEIILKSDARGRVLVPVERQVELVREFERSGLSGPRFAEMAGVKYPGQGNGVRERKRNIASTFIEERGQEERGQGTKAKHRFNLH